MTLQDRADAYATAFPHWPKPRTDERWLDAVWVLGNNYRNKSRLYGAYPPGYLSRTLALFPDERAGKVLHLFSGTVEPGPWVRLDMRRDADADVIADAHAMPFPDGAFDLVLADPPYSAADAKKYGPPMINRRRVMAEIARVTRRGGQLAWLDTCLPMFSKKNWHWWGAISLVRSTNHRVRLLSLFERT